MPLYFNTRIFECAGFQGIVMKNSDFFNELSRIECECKSEVDAHVNFREQLPAIAEEIINSCHEDECFIHIDYEPIPSKEHVVDIIQRFMEILFPGYFNRDKVDPVNLKYYTGQAVTVLFDKLSEQISLSIKHDCLKYGNPCKDCAKEGQKIAMAVISSIPQVRKILQTDVCAAYDGDPAAASHDEVIFSYPGIFAIAVYRIANILYRLDVPLLPRIMSEHAHSVTGIDINPGAIIAERFAIDHGTGIVIGETTIIGKNVRVYQGVTLGALSLPKDAGVALKGKKRHPTIEDDVIIYSGATILGGDTVIGARSVIGGSVWLTESVPPDTKVLMESPRLIYK